MMKIENEFDEEIIDSGELDFEDFEYEEEKPDYFWFLISSAVFPYNFYVITNNLCLNIGYIHVAISVAVNLYILLYYPRIFETILPRLSRNLAYIILVIGVAIGVSLGCTSKENRIEKASIVLVSGIMEKNNIDRTCESVIIDKTVSKNTFHATATMNDGTRSKIIITCTDNSMVTVQLVK